MLWRCIAILLDRIRRRLGLFRKADVDINRMQKFNSIWHYIVEKF